MEKFDKTASLLRRGSTCVHDQLEIGEMVQRNIKELHENVGSILTEGWSENLKMTEEAVEELRQNVTRQKKSKKPCEGCMSTNEDDRTVGCKNL